VATSFTPKAHHPNIASIQLFAQNPEIVTPIGIAVAPDGRVFVQENHTHKRSSSYKGPKTDRILIFEDTDNDGVADKRSVFYEGDIFSTDLMFGPDGHLYVSTRWFVGRFRDATKLKKAASEPEKLVVCETTGDYPHNGVGGLAIDPAKPDWLAFGFGENLGVPYTFVGSDGVKLSGHAEGGSTYLCRTDGSKLTRQSTGHWNAFGMGFDLEGNLFSTDNDPNSTPPNRLLHIVPGADFGYEYRYGRSGRHPLVTWHGEHPGTLGMIGALGEAACGVVPYGPKQLLTASWTDNRIDLHQLKPKGASLVAGREPFISGPDEFRPVHFAYSADGKYLYFTDWVKLSYPVHGHGRIWRIEFKKPIRLAPTARTPSTELTIDQAFTNLDDGDPYVRTAAIHFLSQQPDALQTYDWQANPSAVARAHFAVACKRADAVRFAKMIPNLLSDESDDVRFVAVKWIADENLTQYKLDLEKQLDRAGLGKRGLFSVVAALATLNAGSKGDLATDDLMLALAEDKTKPLGLRALALRSVNIAYKPLTVGKLVAFTQDENDLMVREAVRSLTLHPNPARDKPLAEIAADIELNPDVRADAIAGLAAFAEQHSKLLQRLATDENETVGNEAVRSLEAGGVIQRNLPPKPAATDLADWQTLIDNAPGKAIPEAGRRLFFHPQLGGCAKCHAMQGRGNGIGPDLSTIHQQSEVDTKWLLKHIVNPSDEVAPYYRPQQLILTNGKSYTGVILGQEGGQQAYLADDGKLFTVNKKEVDERRELATSIMPTGLLDNMTAGEIRNLLAYLLNE